MRRLFAGIVAGDLEQVRVCIECLADDGDYIAIALLGSGNGVLDSLGVAADGHGIFRGDGLDILIADHIGNMERVEHGMQLASALVGGEVLEFHREVKAAAGAFLNKVQRVRNPDDGRVDVFHEHVEHALLEPVQHLVGFVDENDGPGIFALPRGEAEHAYAAAQYGIADSGTVTEAVVARGRLDGVHGDAEFLCERPGEFRLAGARATVEEYVERFFVVVIIEQVHERFRLGAVLREVLERNVGWLGDFDVADAGNFVLAVQMAHDIAVQIKIAGENPELGDNRVAVGQFRNAVLAEPGGDRDEVEVLFRETGPDSAGEALLEALDLHLVVFLQPQVKDDFDFVVVQVEHLLQSFDAQHGLVVGLDALAEFLPCESHEHGDDDVGEVLPFLGGEDVPAEMLDVLDALGNMALVVAVGVFPQEWGPVHAAVVATGFDGGRAFALVVPVELGEGAHEFYLGLEIHQASNCLGIQVVGAFLQETYPVFQHLEQGELGICAGGGLACLQLLGDFLEVFFFHGLPHGKRGHLTLNIRKGYNIPQNFFHMGVLKRIFKEKILKNLK